MNQVSELQPDKTLLLVLEDKLISGEQNKWQPRSHANSILPLMSFKLSKWLLSQGAREAVPLKEASAGPKWDPAQNPASPQEGA